MKRLLVISSYPAPYRMSVFDGLREKYQMDVFFATCKDQNRSSSFFVDRKQSRYFVLSEEEDKKLYRQALQNIKVYDAVLAYDWYLPEALICELCAMMKHVPYFINCDGALPESKTGIKESIKRFFIKRAKLCFAGGEYAKAYFLKYGASEKKIVEHKFTSLNKAMILSRPVSPDEKVNLREELGLQRKKMVLSIGQFIERKGFDILLNAWGDLDLSYQLVIIGGGELEESYRSMIQERKYKNITLLNFVPFKEISRYYMASDLFVLPTREDIWGLVINEAMAHGLPTITTDRCVAGLELIKQGENGAIVPVNDSNRLYKEMSYYLGSLNIALEAGVKSLELIQSYTLENIILSHMEVLEKTL